MRLLSFVWLAFAVGLGFSAPVAAQAYRIQPGDRLDISVLEDPALNRSVLVRPDGQISLPLAGSITVGGRTPEEVQGAIRQRLAGSFVSPPEVTVSLAEAGDPAVFEPSETMSIYVLGQVARPGVYEVEPPIDALQALAIAGGTGTFAARNRIQVRRRTPGQTESVLLLNYDDIEDGMVPSASIELQNGDVIVVPERRLFE